MAISVEREMAKPTFSAEFLTVGDHTRLDVDPGGDWIAKPAGATHIQMQALTQNIRYRIDGNQASATEGFQLSSGTFRLIPVPNLGVSVFEEAAGAIVQYQFVK